MISANHENLELMYKKIQNVYSNKTFCCYNTKEGEGSPLLLTKNSFEALTLLETPFPKKNSLRDAVKILKKPVDAKLEMSKLKNKLKESLSNNGRVLRELLINIPQSNA